MILKRKLFHQDFASVSRRWGGVCSNKCLVRDIGAGDQKNWYSFSRLAGNNILEFNFYTNLNSIKPHS